MLAEASGGGTALEVSGPALFSRSGLVTITGQAAATVSVPGGLSASALPSDAAKQRYADEHRGGWAEYLDRLAHMLAKSQPG